MDFKQFMNDIFDQHDVTLDIRNFVFGNTKQLPVGASLFWWDEVLQKSFKQLPEDHEYMLRHYRLLLHSDDVERLSYFINNHLIPENTEDKHSKIVVKMVALLNAAGEIEDVKNLLHVAKHTRWLVDEIITYLYDRSKDQLFKQMKMIPYNDAYATVAIFKCCYKRDSKLFGDLTIKGMMTDDQLHQSLLEILPEIKGQKVGYHLIRKGINCYFIQEKMKATDLKLINDYIDGKRTEKISSALDRVVTAFYNYKYNNYFIRQLGAFLSREKDLEAVLHPLKVFLLMINPVVEVEGYVRIGLTQEQLMRDYELPFDRYLHFLISHLNSYDDNIAQKSKLEFEGYLQSDFESVTKVLLLLKKDDMIALIKQYYPKAPNNFQYFLIDLASSATGKTVVAMIVEYLGQDQQLFPEVKKMMFHKKKGAREVAAMVLINWKHSETVTLFQRAIEGEKNSAIKKMMKEYLELADVAEADPADYYSKEAVIARAGESDREWFYAVTPPPLIWKDDGSKMTRSVMNYVAAQLNQGGKLLKATPEAVDLVNCFTSDSFQNIVDTMIEQNEYGDWLLRALPLVGSDHYLDYIQEKMLFMISRSRGAAAAKLIDLITEFKSSKAIQLLDYLTLKKNAKDARVNRGATSALERMAKNMNLTKEDLLDLIIPDFGFNQDGTQLIDFGPRQFTVKLLPDLTMSITDQNGKIFKNLPKPGKNDDPDLGAVATKAFKKIKSELKKQVKIQRDRLERGFSGSRIWSGAQWLAVFVNNPVMKQFALGLIWGIYQNSELVSSFRYQEDGTFSDIDDEPVKLDQRDQIGVIHPVELIEDHTDRWVEILADDEIIQPFKQLMRSIYRMNDDDQNQQKWRAFEGYMVPRFTLRNTLMNNDWSRGVIEDAGSYYSYDKTFDDGLLVAISFLGDYIGNYDDNKEVPIYDITFYRKGKSIALKHLTPRQYSEIILEFTLLIGKGSGFNADWKNVEW